MDEGIINARVQPKQTKAMDMRLHWLRDRSIAQNQFCSYWWVGATNLGDYWTKHHPPTPHHAKMRSEILTSYEKLIEFKSHQKLGLQGCVKRVSAA